MPEDFTLFKLPANTPKFNQIDRKDKIPVQLIQMELQTNITNILVPFAT